MMSVDDSPRMLILTSALGLLLWLAAAPAAIAQGPRAVVAAASVMPIRLHPSYTLPELQPWLGSVQHNLKTPDVVFSVNFPEGVFGFNNEASFLGSLRKFHDGDIVLGVPADSPQHFLQRLALYDVVVYMLPIEKVEGANGVGCYMFDGMAAADAVPLAQMRYLLYKSWSLLYPRRTNILLSDFRDVFFQSNPFTYGRHIWGNAGECSTSARHVYRCCC